MKNQCGNSKRRTIVKYAILTAVGILIYLVAADYANEWRGYKAYGGEVFLLLLPVFYYLASQAYHEAAMEIEYLIQELKTEVGQEWRTSKHGTDARAERDTESSGKPSGAPPATSAPNNGQ